MKKDNSIFYGILLITAIVLFGSIWVLFIIHYLPLWAGFEWNNGALPLVIILTPIFLLFWFYSQKKKEPEVIKEPSEEIKEISFEERCSRVAYEFAKGERTMMWIDQGDSKYIIGFVPNSQLHIYAGSLIIKDLETLYEILDENCTNIDTVNEVLRNIKA